MIKITTSVSEAASLLNNHQVVAIPTETVYGLAANIYNDQAVKQIFEIKKRPFFNPLIVHVKSIEALQSVAKDIPEVAYQLAHAFWPNPLTLILNKQDHISDVVTGGKNTVAVRMPNHPIALALLESLDFPLAAPSANPFGTISPTSAQHVADYFPESLQMVLDGGECAKGIESTIVGFENNQVIVYRLGALSLEKIEAVVGKVTLFTHQENKPIAPGMLLKHYSPKTRLITCENVLQEIQKHPNQKIGLLLLEPLPTEKSNFEIEVLCKNEDYEQAAKNLYGALHRLDRKKLDLIIVQSCKPKGLGLSINDRLFRASQQ